MMKSCKILNVARLLALALVAVLLIRLFAGGSCSHCHQAGSADGG